MSNGSCSKGHGKNGLRVIGVTWGVQTGNREGGRRRGRKRGRKGGKKVELQQVSPCIVYKASVLCVF